MMTKDVVALMQDKHPNSKSIVLCGIEAHVCVQGTCLELLNQGYDVHVVADAVASRNQVDRMFAFDRMKRAGAFITTSESVILGLVGDSKHPKFREVQRLILESAPDTGLLP
jgi:isochorismate hydrolase